MTFEGSATFTSCSVEASNSSEASAYGGAIYNAGGDLTFEGSATFTSCSAVASSSSSHDYYELAADAVSGGE